MQSSYHHSSEWVISIYSHTLTNSHAVSDSAYSSLCETEKYRSCHKKCKTIKIIKWNVSWTSPISKTFQSFSFRLVSLHSAEISIAYDSSFSLFSQQKTDGAACTWLVVTTFTSRPLDTKPSQKKWLTCCVDSKDAIAAGRYRTKDEKLNSWSACSTKGCS